MEHAKLGNIAKAQEFLSDLTELSKKHGIGITGSPVLFVMEPVDKALAYTMDGESRVSFVTKVALQSDLN